MQLARKWRAAGLIAAAAILTTGCYGSFNLTRKLYRWNGNVGDSSTKGGKWANEGVFLVLAILPVYAVCTWVDALVLNSIEFWGGKNPVEAPSIQRSELDQDHSLQLERLADGKVEVKIFEKGEVAGTYLLDTSSGQNTVLRDGNGNALAAAEMQPDGTVALVDAPR